MHVYQSPYAVYRLNNPLPLRGRVLYIDTRHAGTDIHALLVEYTLIYTGNGFYTAQFLICTTLIYTGNGFYTAPFEDHGVDFQPSCSYTIWVSV